MRIAILAPFVESVPPRRYGGTERVISVLTEELVRRGHDVTLFATGDSETSARLIPARPRALRFDPTVDDYLPATLVNVASVYEHAQEFDLIHNHVDYMALTAAMLSSTPTVTTLHGRLDIPEQQEAYRSFSEQPFVSISFSQRDPLPDVNWAGNVYNAIELEHLHLHPDPGDYLVFLGRISPEKRPDRAIEIAREFGMKLIIAAKVDSADQSYFEEIIQPLIRRTSGLVEYIGEVGEHEKDDLLGHAYANVFPIDWPEPFGLTMIESMATGTPVVTQRIGSTPEVVEDGRTGFLCDTTREMVAALHNVGQLDRATCRRRVEERFSPAAMATGYERVFTCVLGAAP